MSKICAVARLSAEDRMPLLLEAVTILKRAGEPCALTTVGEGEMRMEVEGLINRVELSDDGKIGEGSSLG